jgi:iron complex outermembrane receptor protein
MQEHETFEFCRGLRSAFSLRLFAVHQARGRAPTLSVLTVALVALGFQLPAAYAATGDTELADLSLEQLSSIKVTSVSRRAEPLATAPASIYVITNEDIRRSGALTLPEALRLAPNLQVARLTANQYAISARGFNSTSGNKLLVQMDGRSLYTPLYSGVLWDMQDIMLADVDRIEVISGPGATLWGSNAVNGVINIITRSAKNTQGTLVQATTGTQQHDLAARYGAELQNGTDYRVYAKRDNYEASKRGNDVTMSDAWQKTQAGFRVDTGRPDGGFTIQGDAYDGSLDPVQPERQTITGSNLLARWTGTTAAGSRQTVRFIYDGTHIHSPGVLEEQLHSFDLLAQQDTKVTDNQSVVFGAGYRLSRDRILNGTALVFLPGSQALQWANLFAQDDIDVTKKTRVSIGARAEHNSYTGWEFLPSLRLSHSINDDHVIWSGLSRSVRAPSRIDRDLYSSEKPPSLLSGGKDFGSEVANTAELGYRAQATTALSYSFTAFYERFRRLRAIELTSISPLTFEFNNGMSGHTYGVEAWTSYRLNREWRFDAGIVRMREKYSVAAGSFPDATTLTDDPKCQWQFRSTWDPTRKLSFYANVRHVTMLPNALVPSYTALDLSGSYKVLKDTSVSLMVLNAQGGQHREFGTALNGSEFSREIYAGISVVF